MTALSVNLNKIALLRNSRGRNFPSVLDFARRFIALGVHGITIHPRPDERHIQRRDAYELAALLRDFPAVELNIEGYPSEDFLQLVEDTRPDQCTLVPDEPGQLTSDHGWDLLAHGDTLRDTLKRIEAVGVRHVAFLDPSIDQVERAAEISVKRIELYTEAYAQAFAAGGATIFPHYRAAAAKAQQLGLGVNAGHDLDLQNLASFLSIADILEVSIGHALTVECIELGMAHVVRRYLDICAANPSSTSPRR